MSKDILVFNKQGGVGIGVPPVEDLLTFTEDFNALDVYDNNGNSIYPYFYLNEPRTFDNDFDTKKYKVFEEVVDEVPAGYNTITVPSSNVLYVFTNIDKDSVLIDVPMFDISNVSTSGLTYWSGLYAVKINNTAGSDIKIYYKDCRYVEVLL